MTLHWTIDPHRRLITLVADGNVARHEVEAFMDAMLEADAGAYRKLFDASGGTSDMNLDDLMALGVRARGMDSIGATGPLAIVEPDYDYERYAPLISLLAAAERPMKLFKTAARARAWLAQPEIRDWRRRGRQRSPP
ncbi:MAG TPA: hypothetical protein VMI56_20980 [Reyranella sp.]|nr:hypothetical protein [Reyranella sp.]